MLREHPFYERCKKHLLASKPQAGLARATFFIADLKTVLKKEYDQGCHFYYNPHSFVLDGVGITGSNFHTVNGQIKESHLFKDWVTSDKSPWKIITQQDEIEFLEDSVGNLKGFILGSEVLDSVNPLFIKNFAILGRFLNERTGMLDTWYHLVTEKGLDPRDAFILCRFRVLNKTTKEWMSTGSHDGAHWALTMPFDFNRYWNGEVSPKSGSINGFFSGKNRHNYPNQGEFIIKNIDPVIDNYFKWKKQNGLEGEN